MYTQAVYYEPTRLASVYDFESMEFTPEISTALDIYAEESTTTDENGEILQIYSESPRIRSILKELFVNVLDINTNLPMWTRNTAKYGDNFVYLKLDPERGIVGCQQLPNIEIQRLEPGSSNVNSPYIEQSEPAKSLIFKWTVKNMEFQSWEIAHFRLMGDDRKLPYGTSMLEKARRTWRQLLLAEDAMLIYRISRAPERRVFKVFVGNMDDNDVEPYVNRVANKFKREQIADSKTGNVDLRYNQMAVDQDYFIPVRDPASPSPIETLPGACISLDTKIPLLDGRVLPLSQIIEEWDGGNRNLWVYSCNPENGDLAPGMITWAGVTRKNADVLKITLDNGKEVIATPDHKFVHREKGFVEAQDLTVGDSLMPFYTQEKPINIKKSTYQQVWNTKTQKWEFTHRMVANYMKSLGCHKEFTYKEEYISEAKNTIHHYDINRYNNTPNNLYFMNAIDHHRYHAENLNPEFASMGGKALKNKLDTDSEFKKAWIEERILFSKRMWEQRTDEERKLISQKQSDGIKNFIDNLSEEEKRQRFSKNIHSLDAQRKASEKMKEWSSNPENLKKRGESISRVKKLPDNRNKISHISKKNWESEEYRDKVFSKNQKIIFNEFIFNKFLSVYSKTQMASEILIQLNNDSEFIAEFFNINSNIRSRLTNLKTFTHNHLDKMLKSRGYKNFKQWKLSQLYNHKIVKIEILENKIDTGTITVDGNELYHNYHTFAIESGIFIKNSNLGEIADIEYIQRKLVTALRIPKAFLGFEEAVADGKTLALQDIRFARTINRIQKSMLQELNKIAIIHLFLMGFEDELTNFTLTLNNPSTQSDLLKIDIWKEKIQLYKEAVADPGSGIQPVSATWAKKHIFNFSDEEIRVDLQQQRIERAVGEELKATPLVIKKTGIFEKLDSLYGGLSGETPTQQTGVAPMGEMPPPMGGETFTPPPMEPLAGEAPAGEALAGEAPPPEQAAQMENLKKNLNLLVESNMIKGSQYVDLSQGQILLKNIENELNKILDK
jgi:hypothetical protein